MSKSYFGRRQTHAAGRSWSKWGAPLMVKPWWMFKAGMVGYWLICASIGAMLGVLAR